MLCKKPNPLYKHSLSGLPVPCGQCLPCRISKRRVWAHRLVLEQKYHEKSSFLTLTYSDEHLPRSCEPYAPLSVSPAHHTKFMKDLRDRLDYPIRFYMVGEYGERTNRPHYHYALYGYPPCVDSARVTSNNFRPCRCSHCLLLSRTWGKGHILNGMLTLDSANYIAGYVTKKLTSDKSDFQKAALQGRHPEFGRMSRRPGIGALAADNIAKSLQKNWLLTPDEVPNILVHGDKPLPLGRYLKDRTHYQMGHIFQDGEKIQKYEAQLRAMLSDHADHAVLEEIADYSLTRALSFLGKQKILDLETKQRLFRKEKIL